ncbi:MAG: acetyl-CoA synthase subunit gamma [Deltaproteobacteria bacterium]|nr:acetyl-CoA synthase subunit gamma [Deltaproteobacteria bacterium]MBZ0218855.1 acetyl-CoA synthase subunit gamma [Deltaproteobacteria bacterium]
MGAPSRQAEGPLRTSSDLNLRDRLGHLRCRIGSYRMRHAVKPGLYSLGSPDEASDVFVTGNYKMSFDMLRSSLSGMDAWILVLDTRGINVWCAAGKGTFGTGELVKKVFTERLHERVSHRRLILPQLGAPGVSAHDVKKETGFRVVYGPVRASDIKGFVSSGYKCGEGMRKVRSGMADRFVLTPMELRPAFKWFMAFSAAAFAASAVTASGVSLDAALDYGLPLVLLGLVSVLAGALLTPMFLPYIPFRPFALKGWLTGLFSVLAASVFIPLPESAAYRHMTLVFFPLASSYFALQFTGSSTYTGISGVEKELRFALPVYAAGLIVSIAFFASFKAGWL